MKKFDSRSYSINDFIEWDSKNQLMLNPNFQRRSVWNEKAKSYLIDTILNQKPIAKIFIRQMINVSTKTSIREVIDGQQRLRTILSFVKDGFRISRSHSVEYGGMLFSELPENIQEAILSYELSVDLLVNLPDAEVLDIFSRLNSYSVVLNEQEKINAEYFGAFRVLVDKIAYKYNEYWKESKLFTPRQILRMAEVSLVADTLIALIEGTKSKKQILKYYSIYEDNFAHNSDLVESAFDHVMQLVHSIFPNGLADTEFHRPVVFYSLFSTLAKVSFPTPSSFSSPVPLGKPVPYIRSRLDRVQEIFSATDITLLSADERAFLENCTKHSTDESVRISRNNYLTTLIA